MEQVLYQYYQFFYVLKDDYGICFEVPNNVWIIQYLFLGRINEVIL